MSEFSRREFLAASAAGLFAASLTNILHTSKNNSDIKSSLEEQLLEKHPYISPNIIKKIAKEFDHINKDRSIRSYINAAATGLAYYLVDGNHYYKKAVGASGLTFIFDKWIAKPFTTNCQGIDVLKKKIKSNHSSLEDQQAEDIATSLKNILDSRMHNSSVFPVAGAMLAKPHIEEWLDKRDVNKQALSVPEDGPESL